VRRPLIPLIASATIALTGCAAGNEDLADDLAAVTGSEQDDLAAVTGSGQDDAAALVPVEVSTELLDPEGSDVGTAWFRDDDGRAVVEVQVAGLTAGFHPMYLREAGSCAFEDTGASDPELLELPALLVLENGVGSMSTVAGSMALDTLLAEDGTALVIGPGVETLADVPPVPTEDPAAFVTGSRVACGAVG